MPPEALDTLRGRAPLHLRSLEDHRYLRPTHHIQWQLEAQAVAEACRSTGNIQPAKATAPLWVDLSLTHPP